MDVPVGPLCAWYARTISFLGTPFSTSRSAIASSVLSCCTQNFSSIDNIDMYYTAIDSGVAIFPSHTYKLYGGHLQGQKWFHF
jgi:hypothetical protein